MVVGRQSSDLIWTLGCHRAVQSRCFKAFCGMILRRAHRVHTKWACIDWKVASQLAAALHRSSERLQRPVPPSPKPIVKNYKQTGWKPLQSLHCWQRSTVITRKSCACTEKISGGMNVIDLNSSAPASTCRTFQQSNAGEAGRRICNYFFLSVYENSLP